MNNLLINLPELVLTAGELQTLTDFGNQLLTIQIDNYQTTVTITAENKLIRIRIKLYGSDHKLGLGITSTISTMSSLTSVLVAQIRKQIMNTAGLAPHDKAAL